MVEVHPYHRRIAMVASLAIVLVVAGVARRGHSAVAAELTVTSPSTNPTIAAAALEFLTRRNDPAAFAREGVGETGALNRLRTLYRRPQVVGLVHPRRNVVVAGVEDRVPTDDGPVVVYTVITMLNTTGTYEVFDTVTTCDRGGGGLVVTMPAPDTSVVVALHARTTIRLATGSRVAVPGDGAEMRAWRDPRLRVEEPEVVALKPYSSQRTTCGGLPAP